MATIHRKASPSRRISGQSTISSALQTTLAADAVRALGLRPGMKLSQTVEGNRLILEPLSDVDSLAGSLRGKRAPVSIEKMTRGAKAAIARAGQPERRPDG
jgi:hypothetical protein